MSWRVVKSYADGGVSSEGGLRKSGVLHVQGAIKPGDDATSLPNRTTQHPPRDSNTAPRPSSLAALSPYSSTLSVLLNEACGIIDDTFITKHAADTSASMCTSRAVGTLGRTASKYGHLL